MMSQNDVVKRCDIRGVRGAGKVNQKKRIACLTLAKPGEKVTIDPATYPDFHMKDLVVKCSEGESI
jgi:succinate dehydrogenase/fumarate reductase-like Fe-S protein